MKLFTTQQIAELDKYTIAHEPISDIDLMERASAQITNWIKHRFTTEQKMVFFAGFGNNGGDALAIARQLAELGYSCEVFRMNLGKELKNSPAINWQRLEKQGKVKYSQMFSEKDFPNPDKNDIILDGLFGSGLSRPLKGLPAAIVQQINQTSNVVIAIDIPSGLMGEDNTGNNTQNIVKADYTLTFQFPKLSFFFAGNEQFTGKWSVLPIHLHPDGIKKTVSDFFWLEKENIQPLIPVRSRFGHKGNYGHALLIAGSYEKMGAAILASKACLRSGAGLLTTHVPQVGYNILQTAVPEAMASIDRHDSIFTEVPDLSPYAAIGVGPGLDKKSNTEKALLEVLEKTNVPMVVDADALNILSKHKEWLRKLPEGAILTPHPGEFKRLTGPGENTWQNIQKQVQFSAEYNCIVILKGAFTSIALPDGKLFFNSTGNPGMATAGSGDVLTGIILSLLAQNFSPANAALTGVYLHGLAGDIAAKKKSEYAMVAGDIIKALGKAFKKVI